MVRIFGHHISFRAVLLSIFEISIFLIFFNISKIALFEFLFGEVRSLYAEGYILPLFCLVLVTTASACGLYNRENCVDPHAAVVRVLTVAVLIYFLLAVVISGTKLLAADSPNLEFYYAVALGGTSGYFLTTLLFRYYFVAQNFNGTALERRVLVLGVDTCASKIERSHEISRSPYTTVGFLPIGGEAKCSNLNSYKVLPGKHLEQSGGLLELARTLRADEVVVASRERRGLQTQALLECKLAGFAVTEFTNFWERQTGQIDLDEINPSWLIFSNGFRASWARRLSKRLLDIAVALAVLVMTLPLTLLAVIVIKLDSAGSIFYRQQRVGLDGRPYNILKFRSMRVDAEKDGIARWAQRNDSRVTVVGRILRRTRIDEIPQVINVLMGDMSFVGPRPERPAFVTSLSQKIPYYDVRHHVKPGITGWAQVNYPYGASDEDSKAKLAYDLYYVKNWNLFLDFVILFQTARVVLWQEGAR